MDDAEKELHDNLVSYRLKCDFERLIKKAAKAGYSIVADSDSIAIRIIPTVRARQGGDLRQFGEVVKVHDACGGGGSKSGGSTSNYGNS